MRSAAESPGKSLQAGVSGHVLVETDEVVEQHRAELPVDDARPDKSASPKLLLLMPRP